jgi:hypothetical protein
MCTEISIKLKTNQKTRNGKPSNAVFSGPIPTKKEVPPIAQKEHKIHQSKKKIGQIRT